jgi:ABC-type multidrug transport system permease subunit
VARQWIALATLAVAGTAVGLFLSALTRSEEVATALVPIAVIPQIILAGVVAPLNGLAAALAKGLVTVYWGQQALESLLPEDALTSLGHQNQGFGVPWAVVVVQAMAAAAATVVDLWQTKGKAGLR